MQIIMPKLGLTMTQGTITEWLKSPGDAVRAEEALCAYETEKVTLELVAPEDGVLVEILAPAGATVPAGGPVCEFRVGAAVGAEATATAPVAAQAGPVLATPKARALAREWGVALAALSGSGPGRPGTGGDVAAVAGARARSQAVAPVPADEPASRPRRWPARWRPPKGSTWRRWRARAPKGR